MRARFRARQNTGSVMPNFSQVAQGHGGQQSRSSGGSVQSAASVVAQNGRAQTFSTVTAQQNAQHGHNAPPQSTTGSQSRQTSASNNPPRVMPLMQLNVPPPQSHAQGMSVASQQPPAALQQPPPNTTAAEQSSGGDLFSPSFSQQNIYEAQSSQAFNNAPAQNTRHTYASQLAQTPDSSGAHAAQQSHQYASTPRAGSNSSGFSSYSSAATYNSLLSQNSQNQNLFASQQQAQESAPAPNRQGSVQREYSSNGVQQPPQQASSSGGQLAPAPQQARFYSTIASQDPAVAHSEQQMRAFHASQQNQQVADAQHSQSLTSSQTELDTASIGEKPLPTEASAAPVYNGYDGATWNANAIAEENQNSQLPFQSSSTSNAAALSESADLEQQSLNNFTSLLNSDGFQGMCLKLN